jgi:hypothetical protein
MANTLKQIVSGVTKHPWRAVSGVAVAYSVLWTALDSLTPFFPSITLEGTGRYLSLLTASILAGLIYSRKRDHVHFRLRTTNTVIDVRFADIFAVDGVKAIPANEFFDCEIGDHVSAKSLHGQFIRNFLGGHADAFAELIDRSIGGKHVETVQRSSGRMRRYSLGTTALVPMNENRFLFFASARTDVTTLKAHSTVPELWLALEGLWDAARIMANGERIVVPLVGGGVGGINLPPEQLLRLIVLSIVTATRVKQIAPEVAVVIRDDCFDEVDLTEVKKSWG